MSFWSFWPFFFLRHGIEEIETHFLWKFHRKKEKLVKCATKVARLHKVSIQSCTQNRSSPKVQSPSGDRINFLPLGLSPWNSCCPGHEPRAARRRVKEALHIRTEKNPMNKDRGLELDPIWFSVVWIFSYQDRFYANFPNSEPSPKLLPFFLMHCCTVFFFSFLVLLSSSCSLVTLDTLRLIHKRRLRHRTWRSHNSDATTHHTFQIVLERVPVDLKRLAFSFSVAYLKMAGATRPKRRALQNSLLVWWDKYVNLFIMFMAIKPSSDFFNFCLGT